MLTEAKHLIKRLLRHLVYSDEQWLVILVLCVCVIHVIGLIIILIFY